MRFGLGSSGLVHLRVLEVVGIEVSEDGPGESNHLACDCGGSHLLGLLFSESVIELVEPVLTLPGMCDDRWILSRLTLGERGSHGGSPSVVPGGLNENVSDAGVAGLGDRSEPPSVARGGLTGHKPQIGHELARGLEAPNVPDLGCRHHGSLGLEPGSCRAPL